MRFGLRRTLMVVVLGSAAIFLGLGTVGAYWLHHVRSNVRGLGAADARLERLDRLSGAATAWQEAAGLDRAGTRAVLEASISALVEEAPAGALPGEVLRAWQDYRASPGDAAAFASFQQAVERERTSLRAEGTAARSSIDRQLLALETMALACAVFALVLLASWPLAVRPAFRVVTGIERASRSLVEREFEHLKGALARLAAGDLTAGFVVTTPPLRSSGRDELGRMAAAFDAMLAGFGEVSHLFERTLADLRSLVGSVRAAAADVEATAHAGHASAVEIASATGGVFRALEQVTQGSIEQAARARTIAQVVDEVTALARVVATAAEEQQRELEHGVQRARAVSAEVRQARMLAAHVERQAQANRQRAVEGSEIVAGMRTAMRDVHAQVAGAADAIVELERRSREIARIVELIAGLAKQTTFLALNAAIEAARAEGGGKGFAVVAEEVRKLAERSAGAAQEIATLADGIRAAVGQVEVVMESANRMIEQTSRASETVTEVFAGVTDAAQEIARRNRELVTIVERVDEASRDLHAVLERIAGLAVATAEQANRLVERVEDGHQAGAAIARLSQENAVAVEGVTDATQRIAERGEEIARSAAELAGLAEQLQQRVQRFRLGTPEQASGGEAAGVDGRSAVAARVRAPAGAAPG